MNSSIHTSTEIAEPGFGAVWTADDGTACATVRLGASTIRFEDPQTARQLAAACTAAADAMDAEIKRVAEAGQDGAR